MDNPVAQVRILLTNTVEWKTYERVHHLTDSEGVLTFSYQRTDDRYVTEIWADGEWRKVQILLEEDFDPNAEEEPPVSMHPVMMPLPADADTGFNPEAYL